MANRREHRDEDIEHSLETRVSMPAEPLTFEEERRIAIREVVDFQGLDEEEILKGVDLASDQSILELTKEVQSRVEETIQKKQVKMTPEEMLDKINNKLAEIKWPIKKRKLPNHPAECESLKDKTVVMVDDQKDMLEHFVAGLMMTTNGKASFIQYTGQSMDELVRQIMECKPNIILMDYHLTKDIKGTSVVKAILDAGFTGGIIGFSSDDRAIKEFANVGAKGTVDKISGNALAEVAKLVAEK